MTAIVFTSKGTISNPQLGKYSPIDFLGDGGQSLYAGYLLATDFWTSANSVPTPAGANSSAKWYGDLSYNSRTLTLVGTPAANTGFQPQGFLGNINYYLNAPFTLSNVADAGTVVNEYEIIWVAKSPVTPTANANFQPIKAAGALTGNTARLVTTSDNTYDVQITAYDDTQLRQLQFNPASAWRDTNYYATGISVNLNNLNIWRGQGGSSITESSVTWLTTTGTRDIGGPTINIATSAGAAATKHMSAVLFYNRRLTTVERQTVYDKLRLLHLAYGITV